MESSDSELSLNGTVEEGEIVDEEEEEEVEQPTISVSSSRHRKSSRSSHKHHSSSKHRHHSSSSRHSKRHASKPASPSSETKRQKTSKGGGQRSSHSHHSSSKSSSKRGSGEGEEKRTKRNRKKRSLSSESSSDDLSSSSSVSSSSSERPSRKRQRDRDYEKERDRERERERERERDKERERREREKRDREKERERERERARQQQQQERERLVRERDRIRRRDWERRQQDRTIRSSSTRRWSDERLRSSSRRFRDETSRRSRRTESKAEDAKSKKSKEELEREHEEYVRTVEKQMSKLTEKSSMSQSEMRRKRLERLQQLEAASAHSSPKQKQQQEDEDEEEKEQSVSEDDEESKEVGDNVGSEGGESSDSVILVTPPIVSSPSSSTNGMLKKKKPPVPFSMFDANLVIPDVLSSPALGSGAPRVHTDSCDDSEGYYRYLYGEVLHDRYEVIGTQGKGVFSSVYRVRDKKSVQKKEYVIKIIRSRDDMRKAGLQEIDFLKVLAAHDKENKKHCIRLIKHFEHENHLCLVFEPFCMNLRQLLKKYGTVGLNIDAIRSYAHQLFIALRHMRKCGIMHADIKPDNILIDKQESVVKICDFGSATRLDDCTITPYMCSRYYRAPEIMLGCKYGASADVWSIGCCLFELYTGKILFLGKDNNAMLNSIMKLRGKFPRKTLRKGLFVGQHFDGDLVFEQNIKDEVTNTELKRKVNFRKALRDFVSEMHPNGASLGSFDESKRRKILNLKDLLEKCLCLDGTRRMTPEQALKHPFLLS